MLYLKLWCYTFILLFVLFFNLYYIVCIFIYYIRFIYSLICLYYLINILSYLFITIVFIRWLINHYNFLLLYLFYLFIWPMAMLRHICVVSPLTWLRIITYPFKNKTRLLRCDICIWWKLPAHIVIIMNAVTGRRT